MMAQALGRRIDRLSDGRFAAVAVAPGLLLIALFVVPPLAAGIGLSLFRIELIRDDITPFVGLRNFATRMPADAAFLETLPQTIAFALIATVVAVPVALGAALLIARSSRRVAAILWLLLVLPWAIAPVASGLFWRLVFDAETGVVNHLLRALGLPAVELESPAGSLLAVGIATIWRTIPLLGILILGALRQVPPELSRAARMDGASSWQTFRNVTLPVIGPSLVAACVIQLVLTIQVFDVQFALTASAPPRGSVLAGFQVYTTVINDLSLGYGAAQAVAVALIAGLASAGFVLLGGLPRRLPDLALRARGVPVPRIVRRAVRGLAITALTVWLVGPLAWIVVSSTQPERALTAVPAKLGLPLTFDAYEALLVSPVWRNAALNSLVITTSATLLALVIATLTAYPLARYRPRGGRTLTAILVGTQLLPPIALAIPALLLFIRAELRNTVLGLVLVQAAFWTPVLVWLLLSAFRSVPRELERAARIDGASRLTAILRIVVPVAAPAVAAAAAIVFIGIWNDFVLTVMLGGRETQTLPRWLGESSSPLQHVLAARTVLTVAPCVALLILARRRIAALL